MRITATRLTIDAIDGALLIAFSEGASGESAYLMLQRAEAAEPQSVALGHDTYFVELSDQSQSCYGGVDRASLSRDRLRLAFSDTATRALKVNACEVAFSVGDARFDRLRCALKDVFAGTSTVLTDE